MRFSELPISCANPAAMPPSVASRSARRTSRVFWATRPSSSAMSRWFSARRSSSRADMWLNARTRSASSLSSGGSSRTPRSSASDSAASERRTSGRVTWRMKIAVSTCPTTIQKVATMLAPQARSRALPTTSSCVNSTATAPTTSPSRSTGAVATIPSGFTSRASACMGRSTAANSEGGGPSGQVAAVSERQATTLPARSTTHARSNWPPRVSPSSTGRSASAPPGSRPSARAQRDASAAAVAASAAPSRRSSSCPRCTSRQSATAVTPDIAKMMTPAMRTKSLSRSVTSSPRGHRQRRPRDALERVAAGAGLPVRVLRRAGVAAQAAVLLRLPHVGAVAVEAAPVRGAGVEPALRHLRRGVALRAGGERLAILRVGLVAGGAGHLHRGAVVVHGGADALARVAAEAVVARRAEPRLVREELVAREAVQLVHLRDLHRVLAVALLALRRDRLEPVHGRGVAPDARDLLLLVVDPVAARAADLRPARVVGEVAGGAGADLDVGVLPLRLLAAEECAEHRDPLLRRRVVAALAGDALVRPAEPQGELGRGAVAGRAQARVLIDEALEPQEAEHDREREQGPEDEEDGLRAGARHGGLDCSRTAERERGRAVARTAPLSWRGVPPPSPALLVVPGLQPVVLERMLVLHHLHRDPPVQPRPVHREDRGLQVHVVEVHDEEEQDRERRLLAVDDEGGGDEPGRRVGREEGREPEDEPGADHHDDAPEHRPVVELLEVHEAVVPRPLLLQAEHEEDVVLHVEGILRHRQHRDGQPLLRREERQVEEVIEGRQDDEDRADAVPRRRPLRPAEHLHEGARVAGGLEVAGAAERPAGDAEEDDARQHEPVLRALVDVEADDAPQRVRGVVVLGLAREALAQLVDEVHDDVEREEEQRERREVREHDVDDVRDDVPADLLDGLVRDECGEVVRRLRVAARAGLSLLRRGDRRGGVGLEGDRVGAALRLRGRVAARADRGELVPDAGEPAVDRVVVGEGGLG